METPVTTIFLSMALTVAFTRLVEGQTSVGTEVWWIFFYFVFNKVRYFIGDIKFNKLAPDLYRDESQTEHVFNLIFGVSTLFLFIVVGYYVTDPPKFFLFYALTILINVCWLVLLWIIIDEKKDANPRLTIRQIFRNWIIINLVELPITFFAGLFLLTRQDLFGLKFVHCETWYIYIPLGLLFFITLVDLLLHKYFLFDQQYSISVD